MRPAVIQALKDMSKVQARSMGAVLESALILALKEQARTVSAGRSAFADYLKAQFGSCAGHNRNSEATTIFESLHDGKQRFALLTDRSLYAIGAQGKKAGDYLSSHPIAERMRDEPYVSIDLDDDGESLRWVK
jgi:hypothetical protein